MMCHGAEMLSFRTSALLLGVICGIFVQFSSLAVNYFVWTLRHQQDSWVTTTSSTAAAVIDVAEGVEVLDLLLMNLCWSLFTSLIAFSVLAVLRMMIDQNDYMLIQLESYFTFGALGGLCSSWIATDAALGIDTDVRTNVIVLVVASVCFKLLMGVFAPRRSERDLIGIMTTPLLNPKESEEISADDRDEPDLRWMGLQCGLLIGLFIQLSGLGADTLLSNEVPATERHRLFLSMGWSFMTSCLGILALFFVRQILLIGSRGISAGRLVAVECFFASGATVGLNAAWAITDTVLGLKPHLCGSVIATLATFAWCKLILHCSDESCADQQRNEEDGTITLTGTPNKGRCNDEGQGLLTVDEV
jgi:hypothetical protein